MHNFPHKDGIKRVESVLLHKTWVKLNYCVIRRHTASMCNRCLGLVEEHLAKETEGSTEKCILNFVISYLLIITALTYEAR